MKRVTTHKMMTRTLKYTPVVEADEPTDVAEGSHESPLQDEQEHNINRRSLSLVSILHSITHCLSKAKIDCQSCTKTLPGVSHSGSSKLGMGLWVVELRGGSKD